jgi:hypothetical protein
MFERMAIAQHCVDVSCVLLSTLESGASTSASATAMVAWMERDASIASSHVADLIAG